MALSAEDLAQLGQFIENKVKDLVAEVTPAPPEPQERASVVGVPDVPFDAGPEFYIALANGETIKSHDSSSTHMQASDGTSVQVIGRYQVGG